MALQERLKIQLRRDVRVMGLILVRVLSVGSIQWLPWFAGLSRHCLPPLAVNHSSDLRGAGVCFMGLLHGLLKVFAKLDILNTLQFLTELTLKKAHLNPNIIKSEKLLQLCQL